MRNSNMYFDACVKRGKISGSASYLEILLLKIKNFVRCLLKELFLKLVCI